MYDLLLKISALLIPVYFVYYGPINENPNAPRNQILRKYMYGGFVIYIMICLTVILFTTNTL